MSHDADTGGRWYVHGYKAKGDFIHVIGPGNVFILTQDEAAGLAAQLIKASHDGSPGASE
jgi:hypothetical protein